MAVPPSAPLPCSPFYLRRQAPCPQCSWGMEEKAAAGAGCREPPGPPRAAAIPCFGISVDQDDILPGALRLIRELRPHWKPQQVRTKRFTDGITNKLVACYVEEDMQDCVLVRVYGERTELLVDRENEVRNFQLLRAHGCAPKLYCTFQNGLCYEYMRGMALGPEHIREPRLFRLIALEMAKIHTIHANGSLPKPILWHKMHNYFTLVKNEINPSLSADVPKVEVLERELAWLKEHLPQLDSPVVFCHNDLLCKNIIYDSTKGHVRFIDYEYAGYNYQAFDIGNHFNEFAGVNEVDYCWYPARETQLQWLRYYLQAQKGMAVTPREVERLYVQVNKFALASHFFWALWALIQSQFSTIDFNFLRYAVIRFNQYFKVKPQVSALELPK
ncbi:ethanolamine kinase 2 isoform X1 [Sagmatias obliquidens]|uniref:ethanolamine kinase 2 isoform X1 n=1 Tax=Sagmatias obliquidens TaxID=3371155 RepID=UPI000F441C0A|nr:ethanolamine kinase 2 isoform X1 [Lagenorhynchus obliquidens]